MKPRHLKGLLYDFKMKILSDKAWSYSLNIGRALFCKSTYLNCH
jgi:hypothetical protein